MSTSTHRDAIVIGAGQSGLATARALRRRGLHPVVLEADDEPGGAWPHYYDSLTLFSPARYSALPGLAFPGDPDHYPHRDEVIDYLRSYARQLDSDILTGNRVTGVEHDGNTFAVTTSGGQLSAPIVIAASGGFGRPHIPALPGLDDFTGTVLHASQYRNPTSFTGQRIVIIGAGNSAVQIGAELALHAQVTIATRTPVKFWPQRPLGRDMHFWLTVTGVDAAPIGPWLKHPPTAPVFDEGHYRAAMDAERPHRRSMFDHIDADTVTWSDGAREHVDTLLFATGYQPAVGYLTGLGALDHRGAPRQQRGLSATHSGLGYVGLGWQRSLSSATLRGVGRDATYTVNKLLRHSGSEHTALSAPTTTIP